jgi:oligopeptide transport system substrate-binding protein
MFFRIRGARDFFAQKTSGLTSVREEGGHLVIELAEPTPYFLQVLTLPIALPLRKDILDASAGRWPDNAPSTGPYRMLSRQPDRVIRLEKNPAYRAPVTAFEDIELAIVNDEAAALNLFDVGRVDILTRVSASELPRLRSHPGVLKTFPFLATYYLSFNFRKPPFNDRVWRRAVAGTVMREELVRALDGGDLPASGWVPPGLEGHIPYADPAPLFADSVETIRKRPAASRPGAIGAAYDSGARNTLVMEKVQADLKRELGLNITLGNLDWKSYLKSVQTDPPALFRLGILAPFSDPIQILEVFTSSSPFNYLKWSNRDYDRVVEEIAGLVPGPARQAKIREAQAILVDREAIVVPLYHYVQNHAVGPRVRGFRANPFGVIRFDELKVKGN